MSHRLLILVLSAQAAAAPAAKIDFQRDIRPILSSNCFYCHGPDKSKRMAGLRLDLHDEATATHKNGRAIVPGKPAESLLYKRIANENAALRMPPVSSHKTLTPEQIALMKRWIEAGAPWKEHWSFTPPVRAALPAVKDTKWPRNAIDNFILARLEAEGLTPAPEANRRTLIRRASFDLTGLPPAPADVEAFVNDKSPDAYEKVIDRLLASPHYGEHRARFWLDAARYADTHGIHVDNYREMWPYRDWVIGAYNRNLSFDRFTIEQIAGDMLPNRTMDQQIASGFHRCNVTTNEAGVILDEVDAIYAKDRVDTTGAVFMGLTIGCATCHDHKFDPLSQRDFYSMAAFFRNSTQKTMDGNVPDTPPILIVPRAEDRDRWSKLSGEETSVKKLRDQARTIRDSAFDKWLTSESRRTIDAPIDRKTEIFSQTRYTLPDALPKDVKLGEANVPGRKALHFGAKAFLPIADAPALDTNKPFSIATWVFFPKSEDSFVVASHSDQKDKNRGWMIEIAARVTAFRLTGDGGKSITIRAGHLDQLTPGTWNHIAVGYDGSKDQAGLSIYINGRAVPTQGAGDQNLTISGKIAVKTPLLLGREDGRYFQNGAISDFTMFNRALTEEDALMVSQWPTVDSTRTKLTGNLSASELEALHLYYQSHNDAAYQKLSAQLAALAVERTAIRKRGSVTHVMQEKAGSLPFANILYRGMYDQPRDKVEPSVPAALPPMTSEMPRNRLGLAQWIVDPGNPLTARVTVNRYWQEVFGTGIVKTTEDFGSQGESPVNPELLDWMAVEFREAGWDTKKFFRLLLTSAAYRQSAATTELKQKKDPLNRLLSRGPRFRLDGELLRDSALASSGLLVPTLGGPSVKPYQPDGVWEAVAMNGSNTRFYKQDHGDKLYRRSLYTFWKRSAPPASMDIFNAPTRESCTVRRERTNTPLQALVTLNDVQFVEASRALAQRTLKQGAGDFDKQLDLMTQAVIARPFQPRERAIAKKALSDLLAFYDSNPADAKKLLKTGEFKTDESLSPVQVAAWTMLASDVMNLDEAVTK